MRLYEFLLDCKNQVEIKQEVTSGKGKINKFEREWGKLYHVLTKFPLHLLIDAQH